MFHSVVPHSGSRDPDGTQWLQYVVRAIIAVVVAAVSLISLGERVSAHSDFVGSEPADGSVLTEPLRSVVLTFAVPVLGDGATVIAIGTTSGTSAEGVVVSESETAWRASFPQALQGEIVRVEFGFRAEDGHLVEGEISFDLTAATSTTMATPTTTGPAELDSDAVRESASASPTTTSTTSVVVSAAEADGDATLAVSSSTSSQPSTVNDAVNHVARLAQNLLGFVLVGGLFFAIYLWGRNEVLPAPRVVAATAIAIGVASIVEIATIAQQLDLPFSDAVTRRLSQSPLFTFAASVLFVIAALSVLAGQVNSRSAFRLVLLVPMLGVISAPAFDGHAVTKGPRLVHAVSDVVHMGSAMIWVGSVFGLVLVARVDRQRLATVARRTAKALIGTVAMVALSGVVMTLMIVDGISSLTDSTWGRVLIVKLLAVATAGVIGAVHHWRVVPRIDSSDSQVTFRQSIAVEFAVLMLVITASSWLVVAMP